MLIERDGHPGRASCALATEAASAIGRQDLAAPTKRDLQRLAGNTINKTMTDAIIDCTHPHLTRFATNGATSATVAVLRTIPPTPPFLTVPRPHDHVSRPACLPIPRHYTNFRPRAPLRAPRAPLRAPRHPCRLQSADPQGRAGVYDLCHLQHAQAAVVPFVTEPDATRVMLVMVRRPNRSSPRTEPRRRRVWATFHRAQHALQVLPGPSLEKRRPTRARDAAHDDDDRRCSATRTHDGPRRRVRWPVDRRSLLATQNLTPTPHTRGPRRRHQGREIQIRPGSTGFHIRVRQIWWFDDVGVLCVHLATLILSLTVGICINAFRHHTKEKSQWLPDKLQYTGPGSSEITGQGAPGSKSGSQTTIESAKFIARSGNLRRICLPWTSSSPRTDAIRKASDRHFATHRRRHLFGRTRASGPPTHTAAETSAATYHVHVTMFGSFQIFIFIF